MFFQFGVTLGSSLSHAQVTLPSPSELWDSAASLGPHWESWNFHSGPRALTAEFGLAQESHRLRRPGLGSSLLPPCLQEAGFTSSLGLATQGPPWLAFPECLLDSVGVGSSAFTFRSAFTCLPPINASCVVQPGRSRSRREIEEGGAGHGAKGRSMGSVMRLHTNKLKVHSVCVCVLSPALPCSLKAASLDSGFYLPQHTARHPVDGHACSLPTLS